jgi:four helix bundle protein
MSNSNLNKLRIFQLAEELSDKIWEIVKLWGNFEIQVLGKQIIRSTDSIGANIAEGNGRESYTEKKRFLIIARGSLYETKFFLRRAFKRKLIKNDQVNPIQTTLNELTPKLNSYINYLKKQIENQDSVNKKQKISTNNKHLTSNI